MRYWVDRYDYVEAGRKVGHLNVYILTDGCLAYAGGKVREFTAGDWYEDARKWVESEARSDCEES